MRTTEIIKTFDKLFFDSYDNRKKCIELIDTIKTKKQFINFINKFIGEYCKLYFEHGYIASLQNYGRIYSIKPNFIKTINREINLNDLNINALHSICYILCNYSFYCRYKA